LLFSHQNDISYGIEFAVLPAGLLDLFKTELIRRQELQPVADLLLGRLRKMGNNERDLTRRSEKRRLLNYYHSKFHVRQIRGKLATILLVDGRCHLKIIDEPVSWENEEEMWDFYKKWRPLVNAAFKEKFPLQNTRTEEMRKCIMHVKLKPGEVIRPSESTNEAES
jgi:hypothetical protein